MARPMPASAASRRAILLLGPTGAGKTPLGKIIEERGLWRTRCLHFDFGANLRHIVSRNRPDELISRQDVDFLKEVLRSGALLENEHAPLAERILRAFVTGRGADHQTCIVLNGLPRHVGQARGIDLLLDVRAVVCLKCSGETVLARLRTNVGGDRGERVDDDPKSVRQRLSVFSRRTAPLLEHYRRRGARIETIEVTAAMTAMQMWAALDRRRGPLR